ncbi:ATP-binding protein [Streptomyces hirsutus]|uniref:ATP-binding protein n=1 Tax=Streptomyces hirsutus TaxID=35620 RepID=UPI003318546E
MLKTPRPDTLRILYRLTELRRAMEAGDTAAFDTELRLSRNADGTRLRVEVSDVRGERLPVPASDGGPLAEGGRGLALVAALAEEWGVAERPGGPGKTVWAVVSCAGPQPVGPTGGALDGLASVPGRAGQGVRQPGWDSPARDAVR